MAKFFEKNNIRYKAPIKIENPVDLSGNIQSGMVLYTSDIKTLSGYGYHEWVPPVETVEDRIEFSNLKINRICDQKILSGFTFNDDEFYLTMENQMNFANMFTAKDYLIYPQTIKTKTGYAQLNSAEEVKSFYLSGIQFVKGCLEECWAEKQAASAQIYADYQAELSALTSGNVITDEENN